MPIRKSNDTLFYLFGTIPVIWLALLLAQSLGGGLPELLRNLTSALEQPTNIIWTDKSLPTILICLVAYGMAVLLYRTNQGRTRDGEEHGSAAWATPASVNAQFAQKDSIPLTQHVRLGLDTHKHRRSLNVLVIGGSGAAKTRSFVLPNILTANTNYVITDPKSEVLLATGGYLKEQGYDVRVLNLVNLEQSDGYNPFRYLRDEKDVLKLVNNLIQSTTPKGSHESDPFWTKAETALLQAIILMLFQEAPEYEQNFSMVMRVLECAEVREEDEGHVSPLDLLFESIERRKPDSVAVRQYKVFKLAAGKTAKSILVSTAVCLAPFNLPQIQALTDHDDMDLYTLGEKKVALYAVIPDNDNTFNFLVSLLYAQAFQALYYRSTTARCRATCALCWMSLQPCRCQASPASLRRCAHGLSLQVLSFRIWHRSKNCIRIAGRQFQVTAIPFCILAVTSPVRTNMSPKCLAKPQLIRKRTGRRRANPAPTRPISRCPGANC